MKGLPAQTATHEHILYLCLQVRRGSSSVWVFFLHDTGSPYTYLSPSTMEALGFSDNLPTSATVYIHGRPHEVTPSPQDKHFADLNLLGGDYLYKVNATVELNYDMLTVTMRLAGAVQS